MFRPDVSRYSRVSTNVSPLRNSGVGLGPHEPPSRASGLIGYAASDGNEGPGGNSKGASLSEARRSEVGLRFVEGDQVRKGVGACLLSVFVLWGQTDAPALQVWAWADHVLLAVFVLEVVLRFAGQHASGGAVWKQWNRNTFDASVVGLGVIDLWLLPLCTFLGALRDASELGFFGFGLRLARLLRLVRVVGTFPELLTFVQALQALAKSFLWLFVVYAMIVLSTAIALTHLLGHGEAFGLDVMSDEALRPAVDATRAHFLNVPTAAYSLFQLMTIDNWREIADPLIEINTLWRPFFVVFIALASWTMIAVLTAISSNTIIAATADRKDNEAKEQEKMYQSFIEFLRQCFMDADTDGNGVLDREEFSTLISQEVVHTRMKELGVHMSRDDLTKAWEMLDIDESGELTIEEFVTGLSTLQEGLNTKHMVCVDYSLKKVTMKADRQVDDLVSKSEAIFRQCSELQKVSDEIERDEALREKFHLFMQWVRHSAYGTNASQRLSNVIAAAEGLQGVVASSEEDAHTGRPSSTSHTSMKRGFSSFSAAMSLPKSLSRNASRERKSTFSQPDSLAS